MKTALIIGGGFAGCAMAHQLALKGGWDVTLVEAAPVLGAGVRTEFWGGHPHTLGPRHFLTQKPHIFEYLNRHLPMRRCPEHEFLTYVERDNQFYNYPIHRDDVARMPDKEEVLRQLECVTGVENAKNLEEYWLGSVGQVLYDKMVHQYTEKMWMIPDAKMLDTFHWSPKGVALKEGPRACWDIAISAYPYALDGYNSYFDLATQDTKVLLRTKIERYDILNRTVEISGDRKTFDVIVSTVSPDTLFENCFGELFFIGRDFHKMVFPTEHVFPENVYFLYYANSEQFTRLVEYKKLTKHKSATSLVGMEIPSLNGKHYPLPIKAEQARAKRYTDMLPEGVFSIGRAGSYRYDVDIDDCIEQAMSVAELI